MKYESNDELWRNLLTGNDPDLRRMNNLMKRLPKGPRCKLCSAPFSRPGSLLVSPFGFRRWVANPSLCSVCARGLDYAGIPTAGLESRRLDLKGWEEPVDVFVVHGTAAVPTGVAS